MRFFELIDDLGISFYRWDEDAQILYFWNEVDRQWDNSTFSDPEEIRTYVRDLQAFPASVQEVTEDDVR